MAEMTAAEAISWLTEDKAFGQECYSRKQIAQLIEQLAAEREKVKTITQKLIFTETIFQMPHNVATDTGISFKIATMQEFNRAEMYKEKLVQAEAQCKRMKDLHRSILWFVEEHKKIKNCKKWMPLIEEKAKAALEDKP